MKTYLKAYIGSTILVSRLANLLHNKNILSIIKNDKESGRLAGFGTTGDVVELHILNTDIEASKEIIESFKKEIEK